MTLPSTAETAIIHCMPEVPPDKLFSLTAKKKTRFVKEITALSFGILKTVSSLGHRWTF